MQVDRDRARRAFERYVSAYDASDPKIRLKLVHTWRVAALCEDIARAEGWDDAAVDLAWLAGVTHDLGRFEQVRQFGTFADAMSVGHAELSARLLFDEGLLAEFAALDDAEKGQLGREAVGRTGELAWLHDAVALHSAYRLPDDLDEKNRALCDLLRDADKVDIFRVAQQNPISATYPFGEDELRKSGISDACVAAFLEHHAILTSIKTESADYVVGHMALAFELVSERAVELALAQGFLEQIMHLELERDDARRTFAALCDDLRGWLNARTS